MEERVPYSSNGNVRFYQEVRPMSFTCFATRNQDMLSMPGASSLKTTFCDPTGNLMHECQCGNTFVCPRPKSVKCPFPSCPNWYSTKFDMKRHFAIHSGEKFICDDCSRNFSNRQKMSAHIRDGCIRSKHTPKGVEHNRRLALIRSSARLERMKAKAQVQVALTQAMFQLPELVDLPQIELEDIEREFQKDREYQVNRNFHELHHLQIW